MGSLLIQAMGVMEELQWVYPAPSIAGADRDAASQAFQNFATGVTRLSNFAQRESAKRGAEISLEDRLADMNHLWPDAVRFIASTRQERRLFASKVEFIFLNLSNLSLSFSGAVKRLQEASSSDPCAPSTAVGDEDLQTVDGVDACV